MSELYIGLMSGTSLDGIDAALVDFQQPQQPPLLAALTQPLDDSLRTQILSLCLPGDNEIDRMGAVDAALGQAFAEASQRVLDQAGLSAADICAIGSHGQTIRHRPETKQPFTLQIGDANQIAYHTGITTVCDFRRADMAAGGQGAPLVPAFHQAVFGGEAEPQAVLNIGGIANLTLLPGKTGGEVMGFDTGPGNGLLNAWVQKHRSQAYDDQGSWAASGSVLSALLQNMLADDYFQTPPPKSTGREYFNLGWLEQHLEQLNAPAEPQDVQATLSELTARSIAQHLLSHAPASKSLWICGGGVHNNDLLQRLRAQLPAVHIDSTSNKGIDADYMEAMCFAWLARQTLNKNAGNLVSVTGARQAVILGGIYYPPPK